MKKNHVRAAIMGMVVAVLTATTAPVSAATQSYSNTSAGHIHAGVVQAQPCATYHSYEFAAPFSGQVNVRHGATGPLRTYSGNFTARVMQSATDARVWWEFTDGSHNVSNCSDNAGAVWIDTFRIEITGRNASGHSLSCTDTTSFYRRHDGDPTTLPPGPSGVNMEFASDPTAENMQCMVTDGTGTSTNTTARAFIDQTIIASGRACMLPIAPTFCATNGTLEITGADV